MLKRTDYAEKRRFGRRQTYIRAWIKISGRPSVACIVRDLSEGGALIECEEETWLPYSFRVIAEDKSIDRVCEIRHQNGNRTGVEFMAQAEAYDMGSTYAIDDIAAWTGLDRPQPRR